MKIETQEEFRKGYLERSSLDEEAASRLGFWERSCDCDDEYCRGWTMETQPGKALTLTPPMKTLTLKTIALSPTQNVTYAELIKSCVDNVGDKGVTASEMEERLRVLKALKEVKAPETPNDALVLELEDADAATLKPLVANMRWSLVHEGIAEFTKDVSSL